ncbi:unnamed protein product [Ectocarpus fasciculatus]
MSKELTPSQNTALGVATAVIEGILLQPTLYWKNARALKLPFTLNPRIIYRGTAASMFNEIQMMAVQYGTTGFFHKIFHGENPEKMSNAHHFFSATLGGVISACFTSPVELVMIQQQQFGGTLVGTPIKVIKTHGILHNGIFRGLGPAMMRDSIYVTGLLGFTPFFQDMFEKDFGMGVGNAGMCASMLGGLVAAVPSHPFDIIKTCMQGDMNKETYKGIISTAKKLWGEGGVRRMFNGCMWRTINITATVYIANECRIRFPKYIS